MALILPTAPQAREDVQFYETVCRNRGWFIKAFNERQEAIDWLTSNKASAGSRHGLEQARPVPFDFPPTVVPSKQAPRTQIRIGDPE